MNGRGRPATRGVAVVVAVGIAVGAGACGGRQVPVSLAPRIAGGTVSPGGPDTEQVQRRAVEVAYRLFWVVEAEFDSRYPPEQWPAELARVATDPVLTRMLAAARVQRRQGITVYGRVVPHPRIPVVSGRSSVQVVDCQDGSRTGQADRVTGRRLSVGVARTAVVATVVRGVDGRWRVAEVRYVGGRC